MFKIIAFLNRKKGISLEQMRHHYETRHLPLSLRTFPQIVEHRRNYVAGGDSFFGPDTAAPRCDVISEIWFADRAGYEGMLAILADPEASAEIKADELNFLDLPACGMMIVDECHGPDARVSSWSASRIEAEVKELAARRSIHEVICLYARGQDRLLPDIQRQAFHDDAFVDCGPYAGDPDGYVAYAQSQLAAIEASQHVMGQVHIDVNGDRATGEVYHIAWHRIIEEGVPVDMVVGARYIDEYECRNGQWKISKRREIMDWSRSDPAADRFLQSPLMHLGVRGAADFSVTRDWPQ